MKRSLEATLEVSGQPRDTADNTTQSMPVKEVQSSSHTSYTPPAQPASGYVAPQPDQGYPGSNIPTSLQPLNLMDLLLIIRPLVLANT